MSLPTVQDELFRKAVDQLAHLQSSYENDRITAESFKVGVETIWEILGGVLDTTDFRTLMQAANGEVKNLSPEPRIRVLTKGEHRIEIERKGERIQVHTLLKVARTREQTFDMEGEAIDFAHRAEQTFNTKGFQREA